MIRSVLSLGAFGLLVACSRGADAPRARATPEIVGDASLSSSEDAGARTDGGAPAQSSAFAIVARAPIPFRAQLARDIAAAMPLVQRLPGGGLVVASEYARASSDGAGPLTVELVGGRDLDFDIFYRSADVQGAEMLRWVWSDPALSVVSAETETMRSGPRLTTYKRGATGLEPFRSSIGYWSAAVREGSVLALERTAYEVPHSSMYPKGSGMEQNTWDVRPARVAVLSGKAPAPIIPPGVCPTAMAAAPDGALAITVEQCGASADRAGAGVLRYSPGATKAKVEWFPLRQVRADEPDDVAVFVASADEIYVAAGPRLETWNGKAWAETTPFDASRISSVSRGADGVLWAVVQPNGRLMRRGADGAKWEAVALPVAPADALDEQFYSAPVILREREFQRHAAVSADDAVRAAGTAPLAARTVDAAGDEVLVFATADREGFVLSTRARAPVARLHSISTQRALLAQRMARRVATKPKDCLDSFLVFPEGTTAAAMKALAAKGDAGPSMKVADATVESKVRPIVYGFAEEEATAATKLLAPLSPKRLCGPPVIEREL